jgi:hypothetical protein
MLVPMAEQALRDARATKRAAVRGGRAQAIDVRDWGGPNEPTVGVLSISKLMYEELKRSDAEPFWADNADAATAFEISPGRVAFLWALERPHSTTKTLVKLRMTPSAIDYAIHPTTGAFTARDDVWAGWVREGRGAFRASDS